MSEDYRFRMDFTIKVLSADKETGFVEVMLEPDPRRYEWVVRDGKRYLYDKLDHIFFPENVLAETAKQSIGLPIYWQPQLIKDAEEYMRSRRPFIEAFLNGAAKIPTFEDKSEEFLRSLNVEKLGFVIMSIDLVDSTKIATSTDPEIYAKLISTVLFELSEVIPKFHGHVLKYTGDGLIAYFPEPSFITKNDLAIYCALTLRRLIYDTLNPIFKERALPEIDIRIGLDSGEANVTTIGSPETKQHKDIIGAVVSLAAKIQSKAKPGDIYLGDTTERNLHTNWRRICEPVELGSDWDYKDKKGKIYKVHRIKLK